MIRAAPTPTPVTATAIGSPIATTDPNATISTTTASARPINSDSGGSNSARTCPPISISSPGTSGSSSTMSAPISAVSVKSRSVARLTAANATRRSSLTWDALPRPPYGLETVTPSNFPTSANSSSITACTAGSSMPASERKTIEPLVPLRKPPKWSSRASIPRRLAEAGTSNEASKAEPITEAEPNTTTTTATQMPTILRGCRKLQPPRRANMRVPHVS